MAQNGHRRPRLLIFAVRINALGGPDTCIATAIDQLKNDYEITLAMCQVPDLDRINQTYGTRLAPGDFTLLRPPAPLRWLAQWICRIDPDPASIWNLVSLMRCVRRWRHRFDAVLSFNDETDIGAPVVQYIHYPWRSLKRRQNRIRRPWQWASGFRFEHITENLTLVNSAWTARRYREIYGGDSHVVPPPVRAPHAGAAGGAREQAFLCIGRIAPEKRIERMIDILERVRAHGHAVKFRVVGPAHRPEYVARVRARARNAGDWVEILGEVPRERLDDLLLRHRYGIHAMEDEHFGIAVAELMRGGCIVFAHASGGPVEILGDCPQLLYKDEDDAVEKILALLEDQPLREATRAGLAERANIYSNERFATELQIHIDGFIAARRVVSHPKG